MNLCKFVINFYTSINMYNVLSIYCELKYIIRMTIMELVTSCSNVNKLHKL